MANSPLVGVGVVVVVADAGTVTADDGGVDADYGDDTVDVVVVVAVGCYYFSLVLRSRIQLYLMYCCYHGNYLL